MSDEIRTSKRSDIYHKLAQIIPDWSSYNELELLTKYWKQKKWEFDVQYENPIANTPRVYKIKSTITFYVCQKYQECRIQLALALINSCYGKYENLPNIHSPDNDFWEYMPRKISESEAKEAMELLQKLIPLKQQDNK